MRDGLAGIGTGRVLGRTFRRPRGDGVIVFDRLDFKQTYTPGVEDSFKLVNNLALNAEPWQGGQASLFLGTKFTQSTIGGQNYSGWTHLVGGEVRHAFDNGFDLGLSGSALWSEDTGTALYAIGPSLGYRPNDDTWISLGWNLEGFEDEDFEAAEYTREGPYVKVRIKFDETSLRGLMNRIGF